MAPAPDRARRNLIDDLLTGTDNESAAARAPGPGHDLQQPHRVVAARYRSGEVDVALSRAVELAADSLRMGCLLSRRAGAMILVAQLPAPSARHRPWAELHREVGGYLPTAVVAIGVGWPVLPAGRRRRSSHEALRALTIRLAVDRSAARLRRRNGSDLLLTLAVYLGHDGELIGSAVELSVHRSTPAPEGRRRSG